jgi:hypothetical protein
MACSIEDADLNHEKTEEVSDDKFESADDKEINDMEPCNFVSKEWMDVILKIGYYMQELSADGKDVDFNEIKKDALIKMKEYAKMHFNYTNGNLFNEEEDEFASVTMVHNFERAVDAMFEATRSNICNQFPLFISFAKTPFLADMWRLFINYSRIDDDNENEVGVSVVAFQSLIDTPILHFDERLGKKDDQYKDGIELSPTGFRVLFSSHLKSFSEWKNNDGLFKSYTFTQDNSIMLCPEHFGDRDLHQLLDICTYTLLCMYDHDRDDNIIGGFDGIDIKLGGKRVCIPHYIRNKTLHKQFEKKKEEKNLSDEEIYNAEWNEFVLGSIAVFFTIPRSQIEQYLNAIKTICAKIAEISEAELPNYEEHIQKMNAIPDTIVSKVE